MALRESDAFVLMTYPLAEADKIAVLFTHLYGKIRAVARGARRPKSRFGAGLEPLSEVFVSFYEKESQELVSLRRCELLRSPFERAATPEGEAFLHHVAELVDALHPLGEPHPSLYRLLRATRDAFLQGASLPALAIYFQMWTLKLGGFFALPSACSRCGKILRAEESVRIAPSGAPHCSGCSQAIEGYMLAPSLRRLLSEMFKRPPMEWAPLPSGEDIAQFRLLLRQLLRGVLERELRTGLLLDV